MKLRNQSCQLILGHYKLILGHYKLILGHYKFVDLFSSFSKLGTFFPIR